MFSDKEMENIFKLLAAILHIGNLRFRGKKRQNSPRTCVESLSRTGIELHGLDGSQIVSHETCSIAASLMEVHRIIFSFKNDAICILRWTWTDLVNGSPTSQRLLERTQAFLRSVLLKPKT